MKVNQFIHARTKHVEMDYHFLCEKVVRGHLLTQFVKSKDRLVDSHTKALTKKVFSGFAAS